MCARRSRQATSLAASWNGVITPHARRRAGRKQLHDRTLAARAGPLPFEGAPTKAAAPDVAGPGALVHATVQQLRAETAATPAEISVTLL